MQLSMHLLYKCLKVGHNYTEDQVIVSYATV